MSDFGWEIESVFNSGRDAEVLEIGTSVYQRIRLFAGQVYCAAGIRSWCFNMDKQLRTDSFPPDKEFLMFFRLGGCLDYAVEHAVDLGGPMLLTDPLDLLWIADFVLVDGKPGIIIVIGPIFNSHSSLKTLEEALRQTNVSIALRYSLLEKLQEVPVLSHTNVVQYVKMLHYTITGERINTGDF